MDISPDLFASHDDGELCRQLYQTARRIALAETNRGLMDINPDKIYSTTVSIKEEEFLKLFRIINFHLGCQLRHFLRKAVTERLSTLHVLDKTHTKT